MIFRVPVVRLPNEPVTGFTFLEDSSFFHWSNRRRAWVNVKRRAGLLFRKNIERKTKGKEEGRGRITNVSKKMAYTRVTGHR